METTRFLDETMEKALYNQMDNDMEKRYINIIRKKLGPSEVSQVTIQNLTSFSSYYPFNNSLGINKKLLEQKELLYYVISTTLYNKKFIMVQEDSIAELWPTYMELYNNPNNYSQTFAYMKENKDFLKTIISKEAYLEFSDASLETLVNVEQDEKIISHLFSKGKDFVVKYFSLLKAGFENYDSAKMFVEKISLSENINVAKNTNVRDNIYDKLVDPALKSKYTRIRKLYGLEY